MPGRCAAPPAAAMMTSSPRDSAVAAYSNIQSGVRCADTTRASWGIRSSASRSIAGCMNLRSDLLPMMTPTHGAFACGRGSALPFVARSGFITPALEETRAAAMRCATRPPWVSSPSRTRTYDHSINSRALYQLSYRGRVRETLKNSCERSQVNRAKINARQCLAAMPNSRSFAHDDRRRANVPTQRLTRYEATPRDVKRRTRSRSPMPRRYPLPRSLWRLKIRGF